MALGLLPADHRGILSPWHFQDLGIKFRSVVQKRRVSLQVLALISVQTVFSLFS